MINESKEQEYFERKHFDQEHAYKSEPAIKRTLMVNSKPLTQREVFKAMISDHACIRAALTIGLSKSMFTFDTEGALVRVSPIDSASQRYIQITLRQVIFHLCNQSLLSGHSGEWRM